MIQQQAGCRVKQEQEPRKVIYVNLSQSQEQAPAALLDEWQLIQVSSLEAASDVLNKHMFHVGLVRLGKLAEDERAELEHFFEQMPSLFWIALIDESCIPKDELSRLVYEYFFDYYTLPLTDDGHFLSATLGHTYGLGLLKEYEWRQRQYREEYQMVGASPAIMLVFSQIRKVAGVDAAVLLTGSSGTGKELIARAIHQRSRRQSGPFIAINCGALPGSLVQAELFGHEKGAFTGAHCRKTGRIEAAAGGTLFLDEIGDLPLEQQVNLLRFLQEETIERLGGTESLHIDARVIAATHVDLEAAVRDGAFREDLYYRLDVLSIYVPDLKERDGDIELLANYFFRKFTQDQHCRIRGFSRQAIIAMNNHDWPGNIRELINRVRKAIVMSENRLLTPSDLGLEEVEASQCLPTLEQVREQAEVSAIKHSLIHTGNNVSSAARMLGISRVTLYRLMDKYGIGGTSKERSG
ncbi:sigma-54 dependent transcriptional regulator [Zobellella maritima]|uniref:sigma-54 dependent transcriptional regulator n=1 Tax=Zobellella maritima TaxID=2059725 RepID=UPI000E302B19|nr:sigma-54 dependent transcriptional regulator [Zobellella maritima]